MKYIIFLLLILLNNFSYPKEFIILQSTTSTRDSGFYEHLLPKFEEKYGFDVRVIAVGTGQAIANAKKCDADVLITHHKDSEEQFVKEGYGIFRKEFMFNDYVIIGPKKDPARIKEANSINDALKRIVDSNSVFVSRGDDSGTYKKERDLWLLTDKLPNPKENNWYLSVGQGMGGTLNIAINKDAYTLSDRATWESFSNKAEHRVLVSNKSILLNYYGVIPISKQKCPNAKLGLAKVFIEWLVSNKTKLIINNFRINNKQLFFSLDESN
ncbi:MAG: substrate-binding domain-containing protein [Alphaproteobacteria bacterium]|tara:strand:- start:205 stop:1011 length:807 start_codon:yes stop_codon:yes gene_type:complete